MWWCLTSTSRFSVKSFYGVLNDRGLRCQMTCFFQKSFCPKKLNLFNWLAWKNKILTLENLALRRCNKQPTTTCIFYNSASESVDHLFFQCQIANQIWDHFVLLFHLPVILSSLQDLRGSWRFTLRSPLQDIRDLFILTIISNIQLARNDHIFNDKYLSISLIIRKIDHILLLRFLATREGKKAKLEISIAIVRSSLEFLGSRSQSAWASVTGDEVSTQDAGQRWLSLSFGTLGFPREFRCGVAPHLVDKFFSFVYCVFCHLLLKGTADFFVVCSLYFSISMQMVYPSFLKNK